MKFTDAVFNTCADPDEAWSVVCTHASETSSGNPQDAAGSAYYVWTSTRGDESASPVQTSLTGYTQLGDRGLIY